ncbi:hypothetical protein [Gluconobacter roseus]|uniref:hypothetical protein n=1 Tax=Gluconobacter roseus TaxID=586239 RepID=UPI000B0ACB75|nr:hypothetical protein [Gluconobacter roseus]
MSWTTAETGDPISPFVQKASTSSGALSFDMTGGHRSLLFFFSSSTDPVVENVLQQLSNYANILNRKDCLFLGVTLDAADREKLKARTDLKSVCFLYDADRTCHDAFGVTANTHPGWIELDPMMRVLSTHLHSPGLEQLLFPALLQKATAPPPLLNMPVPVLMLDHVLEPAFCETLIQYHLSHNPQPSPILTSDAAGNPVRTIASSFKRRLDTPCATARSLRIYRTASSAASYRKSSGPSVFRPRKWIECWSVPTTLLTAASSTPTATIRSPAPRIGSLQSHSI